MCKKQEQLPITPTSHVLMAPFPAQGHVNSMLKLAEIFCSAGIHVTVLISDHTHRRLLRHNDVHSRFTDCSGKFQFKTIPDGFPEDHPRKGDTFNELVRSFTVAARPFIEEMMNPSLPRPDCGGDETAAAVTCVVLDGLMSYVIDFGEKFGIPVIYFRTSSACCFWTYCCLPTLVEAAELPLKAENYNVTIKNVPGMAPFVRGRDLPSVCRATDLADDRFQWILSETRQTLRAKALIFNTFDGLEGPVISQLRSHGSKVYTIGPLHEYMKLNPTKSSSSASNNLWEEDRSCVAWLDVQPPNSVIYVSFGSIAMLSHEQFMECWHGLVNSGIRFLWVIRPDSISQGEYPIDLLEGKRGRGYVVGWAPQEEVLAHRAVGGFLTHGGWNSILESVIAGVPMICWPRSADQPLNSRFVGEVWRLGLDMKDTCDRVVIEKMVRDLMEVKRKELTTSMNVMSKRAKEAVIEGGSSNNCLDCLIQDIKTKNL